MVWATLNRERMLDKNARLKLNTRIRDYAAE